jgi:hypothetical protein
MIKISAWIVAIRAALGPEHCDGRTPIGGTAPDDPAALTVARRAIETVLPPRHRWPVLLAAAALRAVSGRLARPAAAPAGRDACRP